MRGRTVSKTWQWDPSLYAPARYRKACTYEPFIPDPVAKVGFDLPSHVAAGVSDAEQAVLALNAGAEPALGPMARLLLRTESIASSKVEGLQVGIRQLARAESKMETGRKAPSSVLEVVGNIDAMQLALDDAAAAPVITSAHIVEIHRKLMTNAPNSHVAGSIRNEQNWVGGNDYNPCGADFVPPPPEEVAPLLTDLCAAMASEALSPLVQAAVVHAQFETIHPFADGNGRTGRALIHLVLRRRGLAVAYVPPISVILAGDRDAYIQGLIDFREDRVDQWLERFASATARAAELARSYLRAVKGLVSSWRAQLAEGPGPRADAAAWGLIEVLPAHPVVTSPVAAAATGRSKAAIHQAIHQLVECGVLEPVSASKRNRSWEAVGLLELLEGLGGG